MKCILFFLFLFHILEATSPEKIKVIFNSIDPHSVPKHLAFYQLYPDSPEGMKALRHVWNLLSPFSKKNYSAGRELPQLIPVDILVSLIQKNSEQTQVLLQDSELWAMEELARFLPNRKLEGYYVTSEEEVLALSNEEVDLARGLFLSQFKDDPDAKRKIRSYEAMLDLMALQILSKIPLSAPPKVKISALNSLIFEEMGFRFPPHSLFAKDIDLYTFLPSVLDSRKGVCLGVSILYLCLAQRLDLNLELITPPGHIYVRYNNGKSVINIETTARGIDLKDEVYLGVGTKSLQQRTIKEVIGLTHFNHASLYWQQNNPEKAIESYKRAEVYIPHDMLLKELLAYNYLLSGEQEKAFLLLEEVKDHIPDYALCKETLAEDLLKGNADASCIKALFMNIDENRNSILKKKETLEECLQKFPDFRSGYFALAATWLQLHRIGEALPLLRKYHMIKQDDPTACYYLSMINAQRYNYNEAWDYLKKAEEISIKQNHFPKALKEARKSLRQLNPE